MSAVVKKKVATAREAFRQRGVSGVVAAAKERLGVFWREGEALELGKFVGRPSPVVRLDGCKFSVEPGVVPEEIIGLLRYGHHERPEREALKKFLDPRLPVVELGGCVGVVSCLTNRRLDDPARHVVVEANPEMLPLLEANRERNGCRFEILQRALAYGGGDVTFHLGESVLGSSARLEAARRITVASVTLREILDARGFDRCTLICDIEGGEIDLVEHEADTLAARVELLIVEVHDRRAGAEATGAALRRLAECGFEILQRDWDTYVLRNSRLAPPRGSGTGGDPKNFGEQGSH